MSKSGKPTNGTLDGRGPKTVIPLSFKSASVTRLARYLIYRQNENAYHKDKGVRRFRVNESVDHFGDRLLDAVLFQVGLRRLLRFLLLFRHL